MRAPAICIRCGHSPGSPRAEAPCPHCGAPAGSVQWRPLVPDSAFQRVGACALVSVPLLVFGYLAVRAVREFPGAPASMALLLGLLCAMCVAFIALSLWALGKLLFTTRWSFATDDGAWKGTLTTRFGRIAHGSGWTMDYRALALDRTAQAAATMSSERVRAVGIDAVRDALPPALRENGWWSDDARAKREGAAALAVFGAMLGLATRGCVQWVQGTERGWSRDGARIDVASAPTWRLPEVRLRRASGGESEPWFERALLAQLDRVAQMPIAMLLQTLERPAPTQLRWEWVEAGLAREANGGVNADAAALRAGMRAVFDTYPEVALAVFYEIENGLDLAG